MGSNSDKLYGALLERSSKTEEMLETKQAPAHIGKAVFAKDFDFVKMLVTEKQDGSASLSDIFGKKIRDDDQVTCSAPLNFGSRKSLTTYNGCDLLPEETRIRLFQLKKLYNNVEIQAQYKGQTKNPSKDLIKSVPLWKNFQSAAKSFGVTDFDVWIDTVQARFYFEEYELPQLLAEQFDSMPMTSSLVRVPGALGLLEGELEADDGVFSILSNTKSSYTVESKNNVVHTQITQDLLDDSAPAIIDKLRKEVVKGIARAYERAILDGDASGTHIDDDSQAGTAKLYVKAFNGLRKRAFDNETTIGSEAIVFNHNDTPSKDMFAKLLKKLRYQNSDKSDLRYILGSSASTDLVTGAIPELFTAFAFGSVASNVTGAVPPVFGVKCVESQMVREDLGTDGKADNPANGTTTYALLVQTSRFMNFVRQATRVWAAPSLPSSDNMLMSAKARLAFAGVPQGDHERSVVMARNVHLS